MRETETEKEWKRFKREKKFKRFIDDVQQVAMGSIFCCSIIKIHIDSKSFNSVFYLFFLLCFFLYAILTTVVFCKNSKPNQIYYSTLWKLNGKKSGNGNVCVHVFCVVEKEEKKVRAREKNSVGEELFWNVAIQIENKNVTKPEQMGKEKKAEKRVLQSIHIFNQLDGEPKVYEIEKIRI